MKAFIVAFCGVLLATPALAEPSGTSAGSAPATPNPTGAAPNASHQGDHAQPQICRRIESDTSRRIGSRLVCHTAAEWREIQNGS